MYYGDIRLGDTIDIKFTTVNTSGVPTTLAGSPVVSAYPGNSTTELTAGITLTVDFDARTGMHNVRVVASSGNGYATATNYTLVITTGTVSGSSVVGYTVGAFSIEARSAVMPTVAGRTLDVSTGGEAGVDWANVGSPTTTVNLSGTTIATTQKVDVETIKTNPVVNGGTITFPTGATLASTTNITAGTVTTVSGNVNGSVGSVTGAVGSVTGAVGSVTGNVGGNVVGSVGSVTGAVGSVTGAVGSVAAGGITSSSLAASAITAMRSVVSGTADSGTTTTLVDAALTQADANHWLGSMLLITSGAISGQSRLITDFNPATDTLTVSPAFTQAVSTETYEILTWADVSVRTWLGNTVNALVSGRVDASVGAMAANVLTATAIAADAITDAKVAADVTIASVTGAVGSVTGNVGGNVTGSVGSVTGAVGSVTAAVTVGTINANVVTASALATDAVAEIADGVWDEAISGHLGAGSTGAALNAAGSAGDPWTTTLPGAYGAGTAGNIIGNNLDAAVTSRLAPTVAGRTLDVSTGGEAGVDWANVGSPTTTVNLSGTTIATTQKVDVETIKTNPVVNAGTITFPTGATLASTTNITAGTVTTVSGNVNGSVGSVTGAVGSVTGAVGSVTGNVGGNVVGSVGSVTAAVTVGTINANVVTASALATDAVAEIADGVWDEAIAGHLGAGSTGAALNAAGSAGDPWTTTLPGAYGAGTAGNIIGNNLDAAVSSRLAPTVSGRTLDVTTTGEAGVDWANVGSPTTTVNLSGTTIATTQKVDVETIKTNPVVNAGTVTFPTGATLASTTNITAGTVTTASNVTTVNGLAANVITAASIADGAIDSATFAAETGLQPIRSGTAQAGGAGTITLDAGATATDDYFNGAIIRLTGGTGAGQTRFVADYVGSTKVLTVAPAWIQAPDGTTTFAILSWGRVDISQWLSVAPNALVSGRVDASVGAMAANVLTATAIAADAITDAKVAADVTIASVTGAVGSVTGAVGSVTGNVGGNVTGSVGSVVGAVGSVTGNVGGNVVGSVGSVTAAVTVGTINANVVTASALATDAVAEIADGVWDEAIAGHLGAGSTGAALNAAGSAGDPWTTPLPGAYGAGTAGNIVGNNLDAAVTSRLAPTVAGRTLDVTTTGEAGVDWANVGSPTTTVNLSGTTIATTQKVDVETIKTNPVVNGGTVTFPTGATLASTTNITAGTIATVSGNVNGSVGSVTGAVGSVTGAVGSVTGNVGGNVVGSVGSVTAAVTVGTINANVVTASALATDAVAEIADGVWDEAIAGHLGVGSTGEALNAAGAAGDPWVTALPGAYGAGSAGNIVGNNLNATVSSRSTLDAAGVRTAVGMAAANLDTQLSGIDTKTTNLPASPAAVGSAMTLATDAVNAAALGADAVNEITAAIKALVVETQGSYTLGQALSIILAAVAGITTNGGTTLRTPDGNVTRISATVNASNERTAMTLTPSS